jgi:hypothetical protein
MSFLTVMIVDMRSAAVGRVSVARSLLQVLPKELSGIQEPEAQAMEYLQYRQFFGVWEAFEYVGEWKAEEVSGIRGAWLQEYSVGYLCLVFRCKLRRMLGGSSKGARPDSQTTYV